MADYTEEEVREAAEAHAAKSPEDLAYEAGQHAAHDAYAREHGIAACPFSEGDERVKWLSGFSDGLAKVRIPSEDELKAAIDDARA